MTEREKLRFESHIEKSDGCWLWKSTLDSHGYGIFYFQNGDRILAHKASYEIYVGPIPEGICCCHKCDVPACVKPEHLWLGTHRENMQDSHRKGRASNGRKLDIEKIFETKKLLKEGKKVWLVARLVDISEVTVRQIRAGKY